jgi:hypothetical protein
MLILLVVLLCGMSLGACLGFALHALLSATKTAEDCAACKLEHWWVA